MQDRYSGDIGDFAKFAVLRGLFTKDRFHLGLVWYLTSQQGDPAGDGRHTRYLERSPRNDTLYRACDPPLFDSLARLVESGTRSVSQYPSLAVLPEDTVYVDTPLLFGPTELQHDRIQRRTRWLRDAIDKTAECDAVMFDPDNGLEVKSAGRYTKRGPKYVFFDELAKYVQRDQTIVIYQHAIRSGTLDQQVSTRLKQLRDRLNLTAEPFGLVWRSVSPRAFLVAPTARHHDKLVQRATELLNGPLGQHATLQH